MIVSFVPLVDCDRLWRTFDADGTVCDDHQPRVRGRDVKVRPALCSSISAMPAVAQTTGKAVLTASGLGARAPARVNAKIYANGLEADRAMSLVSEVWP